MVTNELICITKKYWIKALTNTTMMYKYNGSTFMRILGGILLNCRQ